MRVVRISDVEEAECLAEEWNALRPETPLLTPAWMLSWWHSFGQPNVGRGHQLMLLTVRDQRHRLLGLAPWYCSLHPIWGRVVRFLGTGRVCSDHLDLVCREGHEDGVAASLAEWFLSSDVAPSWDTLQLESIADGGTTAELLCDRLTQAGAHRDEKPTDPTWHVPLPATWDQYLAERSKNHRKRCRRWQKAFLNTGCAEVRTVTESDQLDRAFAQLRRLHHLRRRAMGDQGVFELPTFRRFHREAMDGLLAAGQLRLAELFVEGRSVAVEYQLMSPTTMFSYQSGMDVANAEIGPGNLSLMASIKTAIENGQTTFDLMRGGESYKSSWGAQPRPAVDITIRPGSLLGRLRHGASRGATRTKDWLRSGRDATIAIARGNCVRPPSEAVGSILNLVRSE